MATKTAPAETLPVSIEDVREARVRIGDAVVRTPTLISRTLSELTGATVYLKFENLQFTAAYKERGALNTLLQLNPQTSGVIAASAGNHAQGLAYHANRLGIPSTIVMPKNTRMSPSIIDNMMQLIGNMTIPTEATRLTPNRSVMRPMTGIHRSVNSENVPKSANSAFFQPKSLSKYGPNTLVTYALRDIPALSPIVAATIARQWTRNSVQ